MAKDDTPSNALEMSDEEFMKNPSLFDTENIVEVDNVDHGGDGDEIGGDPPETPPETGDEKIHDPAAAAKPPEQERKEGDPPTDPPADPPATDKPETPAGELTDAQYAEVGRQIMAEFKANGTSMRVKSAEDAMQLMQMGANYHKKMVGLKPSLKTLKLLENHGLLDPEKINYLIDLNQKKPEAIKQLLKDSKLDPLELDLEGDTNYVPAKRTVSDKEMVLDEVLNNISDSPTYERTLNVISNQWDDDSRKAIAEDPQVIAVLNGHMESGIFDQVATAVAYERSLGKFVGVSEFEAYQRVGTYMHENNLFKSATGTVTPGRTATPPPTTQNVPPNAPSDDAAERERQNRKKAASPSRGGSSTVKKEDNYNPLAMSDEEFAKLHNLSL